jgi:hypothetical protein
MIIMIIMIITTIIIIIIVKCLSYRINIMWSATQHDNLDSFAWRVVWMLGIESEELEIWKSKFENRNPKFEILKNEWKVRIQEQKLMKNNKKGEIPGKRMIIKACINSLIRSEYIDTKLNHTDFIRRTTNFFLTEKLFDALLYLRKYG